MDKSAKVNIKKIYSSKDKIVSTNIYLIEKVNKISIFLEIPKTGFDLRKEDSF